jgi:predicted kinase
MLFKHSLKGLYLLTFAFQMAISSVTYAAGVEKTLNEKVFERHLEKFPYLNESNPKIIILFSAPTGMGKTWLAKQLENHLHGVRLSSDEVRALLKKENIRDEKIIDDYILWTMKKVSNTSPNHLIILDRTIDRTDDRYEMYANFAKNFGYQIFLVRLVADKDKVKERIKSRGATVENLLKRLDNRWAEYEISTKLYPADFNFDNSEDSDEHVVKLVGIIQEKIDGSGILQKIKPGTAAYNSIRNEILNEFSIDSNMQQIVPGLYLGNENAVKSLDSSFTNILCFKSEEQNFPAHLKCKRIAISDRSDSYLMPTFQESYDYIDQSKGNILVHCKFGKSRSPAIVIAYIMRKFDVPFDKAYWYVKQKSPLIEPNRGFLEELKVYDKMLRDQRTKQNEQITAVK